MNDVNFYLTEVEKMLVMVGCLICIFFLIAKIVTEKYWDLRDVGTRVQRWKRGNQPHHRTVISFRISREDNPNEEDNRKELRE